jgi:hypothetical protein
MHRAAGSIPPAFGKIFPAKKTITKREQQLTNMRVGGSAFCIFFFEENNQPIISKFAKPHSIQSLQLASMGPRGSVGRALAARPFIRCRVQFRSPSERFSRLRRKRRFPREQHFTGAAPNFLRFSIIFKYFY